MLPCTVKAWRWPIADGGKLEEGSLIDLPAGFRAIGSDERLFAEDTSVIDDPAIGGPAVDT